MAIVLRDELRLVTTPVTVYQCRHCLLVVPYAGRPGRCGRCRRFNTMRVAGALELDECSALGDPDLLQVLTLAQVPDEVVRRQSSGLPEIDRLLGGDPGPMGFGVPGVGLLAGEPGAGKSTLIVVIAARVRTPRAVLISGEESQAQIKARARRLRLPLDRVRIVSVMDVIKARMERAGTPGAPATAAMKLAIMVQVLDQFEPTLVFYDSIDKLALGDEVRDETRAKKRLTEVLYARAHDPKRPHVAVMISHLNKEGQVAGAKFNEHEVDWTGKLERVGDYMRRLSLGKNRHGDDTRRAYFLMEPQGFKALPRTEVEDRLEAQAAEKDRGNRSGGRDGTETVGGDALPHRRTASWNRPGPDGSRF